MTNTTSDLDRIPQGVPVGQDVVLAWQFEPNRRGCQSLPSADPFVALAGAFALDLRRVALWGDIEEKNGRLKARHRCTLWTAAAEDVRRTLLTYAAGLAERTLTLVDAPDPRSVEAVQAMRLHLEGQEVDLMSAGAAADTATQDFGAQALAHHRAGEREAAHEANRHAVASWTVYRAVYLMAHMPPSAAADDVAWLVRGWAARAWALPDDLQQTEDLQERLLALFNTK